MDPISLREVKDADVEIFYDFQRDPMAVERAAFPAREKDAHLRHWEKIQADQTTVNRTILVGREHWGKGAPFCTRGQAQRRLDPGPGKMRLRNAIRGNGQGLSRR